MVLVCKFQIFIQSLTNHSASMRVVLKYIHVVFHSHMALHPESKRTANDLIDVWMTHHIGGDVGQIGECISPLRFGFGMLHQIAGEIADVAVVEHIEPIPVHFLIIVLIWGNEEVSVQLVDHAGKRIVRKTLLIGIGLQRVDALEYAGRDCFRFQLIQEHFNTVYAPTNICKDAKAKGVKRLINLLPDFPFKSPDWFGHIFINLVQLFAKFEHGQEHVCTLHHIIVFGERRTCPGRLPPDRRKIYSS